MAIGSIEPQFYAQLLETLGLAADPAFARQTDKRQWPELKRRVAAVIGTRTRAEWTQRMQGTDICFAPVLDMEEAPLHPHNLARGTFIDIDGVTQPAPAPRFSRTVPEVRHGAGQPSLPIESVLSQWKEEAP